MWYNIFMIIKLANNKWQLKSKDGKKNLGIFNTRKGAVVREAQVNYFKNKNK